MTNEELLPQELLAQQGGHLYTSTACQHDLHSRCRVTCKFCGILCDCICHGEDQKWTAQ